MSSKLPTCIIVDDEPIARRVIEKYLNDYPQLQLIGSFSSATEAILFLNTNEVDIAFLDIQMPKLTGMQMLRSLKKQPLIVITTAYQEFAVESFELDVQDYLLKPFSFERFIKAVNKCVELLGKDEVQEKEDNYIMLKQDKVLYKVNKKDIIYIESIGDYLKLHTNDKVYIANQTIKALESHLSPSLFIRVHKSYIIGIDSVESIIGNMIKIQGKQIPIGESYRTSVKNYFKDKLI